MNLGTCASLPFCLYNSIGGLYYKEALCPSFFTKFLIPTFTSVSHLFFPSCLWNKQVTKWYNDLFYSHFSKLQKFPWHFNFFLYDYSKWKQNLYESLLSLKYYTFCWYQKDIMIGKDKLTVCFTKMLIFSSLIIFLSMTVRIWVKYQEQFIELHFPSWVSCNYTEEGLYNYQIFYSAIINCNKEKME